MENLEKIISNSHSVSDIKEIPEKYIRYINLIGENCKKKKAVYTVLTTLLYYKYSHPEQDIRYHQKQQPGGFSGRHFDTKFVTPILKKLGLPAMAESGWLTRSLEQPYPYDLKYNGKIGDLLKMPFLETIDYIQKNPDQAYSLLRLLLNKVIQVAEANQIVITPLINPEKLTIDKIIDVLTEHFLTKYKTHNGAKLPVLAFHSIYSSLIKEVKRYEGCTLSSLSSLTACDKTNKSSGDIEIFKGDNLYEAIEIKLDKLIDQQIIRIVEEKIYQWNPQRYYILSVLGIKQEDRTEIDNITCKVGVHHGCQIIINGLIPTIKYYLRLITDLNEFVLNYSKAIEDDKELQIAHKKKWNDLIKKLE